MSRSVYVYWVRNASEAKKTGILSLGNAWTALSEADKLVKTQPWKHCCNSRLHRAPCGVCVCVVYRVCRHGRPSSKSTRPRWTPA
jgi:hypothetical protein